MAALLPDQPVDTPPTPLDTGEMSAWRALVETSDFLFSALNTDLASAGVTLGEYQVLVYLSEAPEHRLRMVDLAARLRLSPSGLTRRIDGLVRAGYVERVPSSTDRRVMLAVLSDAGADKLDAAYPVHLASVRKRVIAPVDRVDLAAVTATFNAIGAALAGDCDAAVATATRAELAG